MKKQAWTKKMQKESYSTKGDPRADGPKCATCGDLAAWGTHPACERDSRKRLIVWA